MLGAPSFLAPAEIDAAAMSFGHADHVMDRNALRPKVQVGRSETDETGGVACKLTSVEDDRDHIFGDLAAVEQLPERLGGFHEKGA